MNLVNVFKKSVEVASVSAMLGIYYSMLAFLVNVCFALYFVGIWAWHYVPYILSASPITETARDAFFASLARFEVVWSPVCIGSAALLMLVFATAIISGVVAVFTGWRLSNRGIDTHKIMEGSTCL